MIDESVNYSNSDYIKVLSYQIQNSIKDSFIAYKQPLSWFIKLCSTCGYISMQELAKSLSITPSALSKKISPDEHIQQRTLRSDEIDKICSKLGLPLSAILYLYEKREVIEKRNLSKESLSRIIAFFSSNFESFFNFIQNDDYTNTDSFILQEQIQIRNPDNKLLNPLMGKWFCYFPSSESKVVTHRQKPVDKLKQIIPNDSSNMELYELYSSDHVYGGIFIISQEGQQFHASLEYMTDPSTLSITRYEGILTYPSDRNAIFTTLVNKELNDVIYVIIDTLSIEPDFNYSMANMLFLSSNKVYDRRRPCSSRMILSRVPIAFESQGYNAMLSNLMMNDNIIRIDDYGFNELKKRRDIYASPALDVFLETYPSFEQMKTSNSEYITAHNCAYIDERLITIWKPSNVSQTDLLYLEALLRLHSISPWYVKAKSSKANELLNTLNTE